jgi:uncharacterized protein
MILQRSKMKIGIISDTHDQLSNIKKAIKAFRKEKVVVAYLLGDICSPFSLTLFKELPCSVKAVFGNNDADIYKLVTNKPGNIEFFERFYVDELNGRKIALMHGESEEQVRSVFESRLYDILLTGHTHIALINRNEKTLHINPGSLIVSDEKQWTKPSVAVYNFYDEKAKIIRL